MSIRIKRRKRQSEEIPLASTSDIAFLLIIFFLAASALLELRGIKIPLPKKDAPPMQILKKDLYKIQIDSSGNYQHERAIIELPTLIQSVSKAAKENKEIVVVLQVDEEAPVESVPLILSELQKIGIQRISLSLMKKGSR